MSRGFIKYGLMAVVAAFLAVSFMESQAEARAGGGRSFGSRGSRSYSQPSRSYSQPAPMPSTPSYQPPRQPGGGFLRSMAGGIAGGLLGGMLFRSLGLAGPGMGGGGIGLFEIILIAGIGYLIYRMVRKKRETEAYARSGADCAPQAYSPPPQSFQPAVTPVPAGGREPGLSHIRQLDPAFEESAFADAVMDIFFQVQGAWMNRDLASVQRILTDEMRTAMQEDVSRMLREKRVNRLENIAVRSVEIVEAWQENGQDFITAQIYANLLDYTTDDLSGQVVAGSKTDPVKFEEYWTFTRPVGSNPWKLSAIEQK